MSDSRRGRSGQATRNGASSPEEPRELLELRAVDSQGVEKRSETTRAQRRVTLRLIAGTYTFEVVLRDQVLVSEG